jgi:ribonuclease Z
MPDVPLEKSFLVQKFAKLTLGPIHVIGYSVAGEESVVQVPELDVCFDIGRAPHFALTSNIVCLTHGHMDHMAGLAYYLSQRSFQGMNPGTVVLPRELERPVDQLLRCWRDVERQGTPYKLVPLAAGEDFEVRRDFSIRALQTHHGGVSLGYSLISVREKLKPEFHGMPGPQIAALRKQGVEIQYRLEVPLVTYLGDTTAGTVFDQPEVQNAEVLITECTFFEGGHKQRAKIGRHLHLDHFVELLPTLKNQHIVLTHVSRRTGIRKAKRYLAKRVSEERLANIHFLMDFEGASDAGDVEDVGPPAEEAAE